MPGSGGVGLNIDRCIIAIRIYMHACMIYIVIYSCVHAWLLVLQLIAKGCIGLHVNQSIIIFM